MNSRIPGIRCAQDILMQGKKKVDAEEGEQALQLHPGSKHCVSCCARDLQTPG